MKPRRTKAGNIYKRDIKKAIKAVAEARRFSILKDLEKTFYKAVKNMSAEDLMELLHAVNQL